MTGYLVYDVFTDRPFGGNPLAVIPDASRLDAARMQAIAAEFGFSETAFVLPPEDPAHTARLRIFTPVRELPFAGHPTVGTAVALSELGRGRDLVLDLGIGPVACRVSGARAAFDIDRPLEILHHVPAGTAAACLGLPSDAVRPGVEIASLGLPFVLAELASPAGLAAIDIDLAAFRQAAAAFGGDSHFAVFAWVGSEDGIAARMFAPLDGIPEDPATGSACATLGALLTARRGAAQCLTIRQGVEMGRPSRIEIATDGTSVTVAGQAIRVMEGRLTA